LLSEAVRDITDSARHEARRRLRLEAQKADIKRLDGWLETVENMLEEDRETVPEPLIREIAAYLREINPKLHRALLRNRTREASRVLDVLFDAQELVLPGFVDVEVLTESA
jgi:hypothetical protein